MRYTIFTIIAVGCITVACVKPTGEPIPTPAEPGLQLSRVFTYEGCVVYRFYDKGEHRYFTDCRGKVSGRYPESCGKNCTRYEVEEVETVE